jgi:hypothetical protein
MREVAGCTGNCYCKGGALGTSSSGSCVAASPCGGDRQRACCLGEGTACQAGFTETSGCSADDCHCSGILGTSSSSMCLKPVPEHTSLNGADPRPFYIWGHNPNSFGKIDADLAAGANALEPDVTLAVDGPCDSSDATIADLVMEDSSAPYRGGLCFDTHLVDWLEYVHKKALSADGAKLALVEFDVKTSVSDSAHLGKILTAIRAHLTYGALKNLPILLNAGTLDDGKGSFGGTSFQAKDLRATEGVIIDGEDSPVVVGGYLMPKGYLSYGYAEGSSLAAAFYFPVKAPSIDYGVFLRASVGHPQTVPYAYLVNSQAEMDFFIDAGVDGIIPGTIASVSPVPDVPCQGHYALMPKYLAMCTDSPDPLADLDVVEIGLLGQVVTNHPEIRRAVRGDNPLQPKLQYYGIEVTTVKNPDITADNGTDANLTFTLTGCKGTATITVNTGAIAASLADSKRMSNGNVDHVTIPSMDLGGLRSIKIDNDGSGFRPEWTFQDVKVSSAGWLGPDEGNAIEYQALGEHTLQMGRAIELALAPNFAAPREPVLSGQGGSLTLECPAPPVFTAPTTCTANATIASTDSTTPSGVAGTYVVTRTWTGTDGAGKSGDPVKQVIKVVDTLPPTIACPADVIVAPGAAAQPVDFKATATDACAAMTTIGYSHDPGSTFPVGKTPVTATATDATGNQASCTFSVVVQDASNGADGSADGSADGAADGSADGAADGSADGAANGSADGAADGSADGAANGSDDGAASGATDGGANGAADASDGGAGDGSGAAGGGAIDGSLSPDTSADAQRSQPAAGGCGCAFAAETGSSGAALMVACALCGVLTSRRRRRSR